MLEERRIRTRTPEWRTIFDRIQVAMELTSRLNVLPFSDIDSRNALLNELLGKPLPDKAVIHPPFYSTYGLGIELGEQASVGQACSFLDLGGITVGVLPAVTIGHDSVVGAGAVVAKDVPPMTVVTGAGHAERRHVGPAPGLDA